MNDGGADKIDRADDGTGIGVEKRRVMVDCGIGRSRAGRYIVRAGLFPGIVTEKRQLIVHE
jgi:hypothetical protein